MEQHPIPQNITGFEFKLIGDMTIKQFAYLAGCAVLALLLFYTPLHPLLKFPLVVFLALLGIALAFVPVEGRPLDRWITNFIRALFSPNQYIFHKEETTPDFLNASFQSPPKVVPQRQEARPKPLQQIANARFANYLQTVTAQPAGLYDEEQNKISAINDVFSASPLPSIAKQPQPTMNWAPLPQQAPVVQQPEKPPPYQIPSPTQTPEEMLTSQHTLQEALSEKERLAAELTALKQKLTPKEKKEAVTPSGPVTPKESPDVKVIPPQFSKASGVSGFPQYPNLVSGIIKDSKGDVLPNIIVEVKDTSGNPVRAFKTNKLGQFTASTPLANGKYTIELEDPRNTYTFDVIAIELTGVYFQPLEIISKAQGANQRQELYQSLFGGRQQ